MRSWFVALGLVALAGCGGGGDERAETAQSQRVATASRNDACPAGIPGLAVRVEEIENGGALVLTANPDRVRDLRARLNRFEEIHRESAQAPDMDEPEPEAPAGGERFADRTAAIHRGTVRVVEIPNGARLEARARNDADLAALRIELRDDAQDLGEGRCPLSLQIES